MGWPLLVVCGVLLAWLSGLGLRCLRSARRTRQAADGLVGAFFLGGALGFGCLILRRALPDLAPATSDLLFEAGLLGVHVPVAAIALFTWRVFRPRAPWATALALALAGGTAALLGWALAISPEGAAGLMRPGPLYWAANAAKVGAFAWACAEATLYWGRARRRLALGLADPVVTNRFLLWALWSGAAGAISVLRTLSPLYYDPLDTTSAIPLPLLLAQIAAAAVCGMAMWLIFSPPGFYRRRLAKA